MKLQMKRLSAEILNNVNIKIFLMGFLLLLTLTSCKSDDSSTSPVTTAGNLVVVTDYDESSYMMIKILGKVRSEYPDIQITYFQSKQYDIYEGAFLLNTSLAAFPTGTVVAGIVDPGAGSKRIVFETGSKRVLAPDNGLATWILHDNAGIISYFIENSSVLEGSNASDLAFEDFYAKAICSLISGRDIPDFGSKCGTPNTFSVQEAKAEGNTILGQVLFTDNFGNCITNITKDIISSLPAGTVLTLTSGSVQTTITLGSTYSSVATGENVCFINSSKFLELAVNYGSFSEKYGLSSGAIVKLNK
jgi:S-adenosyl-L-methionine hydrolase (adenosine-forming)